MIKPRPLPSRITGEQALVLDQAITLNEQAIKTSTIIVGEFRSQPKPEDLPEEGQVLDIAAELKSIRASIAKVEKHMAEIAHYITLPRRMW